MVSSAATTPHLPDNSSTHSLIQSNGNRRQRPVHKSSICVQNVLVEFTQRRVKVCAVSKLHGITVDLVCTRLCPETTECVIVTCTRSRIKPDGLSGSVGPATNSLHGCDSLCSDVLDVGQVGGGDVFLVDAVASYTTFSIECAVEEVLGWGGCLVIVVTPGVENVTCGRVDVYEPTDLRDVSLVDI